ncbi:hypothetical protein Tco_0615292 [Tanacetum coccineum]
MPTIEEGEVIKEFRTRDENLDTGIDDYPSYCDDDKKIHIDCAHSLKFSCMIGFEFTHANFFPLLYVNVMSKKFYNSIMKDKMVYKWNNVVGALMNVPISVGTFSVVRILQRFEGMITLYKGDDEVTYKMVRSHLRFKHHTNEQCNKIPPLLKVSEKDEKNGISHAYQKLKGFYKGVLNLGPDYMRNAKTEEWFTRGYCSKWEISTLALEVIEEFRARNDARMVSKIFGYPSDCDHDKKIRIDCAHNLKFSCMIEDMDAYHDEGMGDVIFGEPFLKEFRINARQFEGMITIHNGPRCKEIDKVGEVSKIWKSGSVGVLKLQDGCSTHNLAHKISRHASLYVG